MTKETINLRGIDNLSAHQVDSGCAKGLDVAGGVEHLLVFPVPQHVPVILVEDHQPFRDEVDRIEQPRTVQAGAINSRRNTGTLLR